MLCNADIANVKVSGPVLDFLRSDTALSQEIVRVIEGLVAELAAVKEALRFERGQKFRPKRERLPNDLELSPQILLGFLAAGNLVTPIPPSAANAELQGAEDSSACAAQASESAPSESASCEPCVTPNNGCAPSTLPSANDLPPEPKKRKKTLDVSNAQRVVASVSRLTNEQRTCSCCGLVKRIMVMDEQERIAYQPAKLYLEVHQREVGVCDLCETPPERAPNLIAHRGTEKPAPSLRAGVIVSKLAFGIPNFRLSRMMSDSSNMALPESTMDQLVQGSLAWLGDLAKCARAKTLSGQVLSIDDSFGQVLLPRDQRINAQGELDPQGKTTQAGRMWFALADVHDYGFVSYTPNWKASNLESLLDGTKAQLQGDGYAGYRPYAEKKGLTVPAGCIDHARRKFLRAYQAGHLEAGEMLLLIGKLHHIEDAIQERRATLDDVLKTRQSESLPTFEGLSSAVHALHERRMTNDLLSRATTYFIKQEKSLRVFLQDPRVPIANTHVERIIRIYAVMRAACKQMGSPAAARRTADGLTLVINAILAKVHLHEYFTWLFEELPRRGNRDLEDYLPQTYAKRLAAAREEQASAA
jgi:hypothetical protein